MIALSVVSVWGGRFPSKDSLRISAKRPYGASAIVAPSSIGIAAEQSSQPYGQIMDERGNIALFVTI